jgi:tRNA(fMet)-specific endonuclease VapC
MSGSYLLDANIVIALFAGDTAVSENLKSAVEVFIPSIVIGELFYGARKSSRVSENTSRINDFVESNVILSCDVETARRYGEIKDNLRQKGRPIPENDIWIAALALQHRLVLVSRDAHFRQLEDLELEVW